MTNLMVFGNQRSQLMPSLVMKARVSLRQDTTYQGKQTNDGIVIPMPAAAAASADFCATSTFLFLLLRQQRVEAPGLRRIDKIEPMQYK